MVHSLFFPFFQHCRICGQIFCSKCTIFISGKYLRVVGSLRVCNKCQKFVQDNLQNGHFGSTDELSSSEKRAESPIGGESTEEKLSQRFSHLSTKSGSDTNLASGSGKQSNVAEGAYEIQNESITGAQHRGSLSISRKSSYAGQIPKTFMSESCDNINEASPLLINFQRLFVIWHKLTSISTLPTRSHKYKMRVYPDTFLGEELIAWLYENEGLTQRKEAVDCAQALLDGELIEDVTNVFNDGLGGPRFHGSIPYKLKERKRVKSYNENFNEAEEEVTNTQASIVKSVIKDDLAPDWLQDMEYAQKEHHAQVSRVVHKNADNTAMSSPVEHKDLNMYFKGHAVKGGRKSSSEIPSPALDNVYKTYQSVYLKKLLDVEGLSTDLWMDFVEIFCDRILSVIDTDTNSHCIMDVREKVKIKCISGGLQKDSAIVVGEVFTNKVIRSDMPPTLTEAKILLVQEAISFHRPDKFVSIANLHLVEEETVKNICNKIKALHPDLILVGQNVCRLAQDILVEAGICVIQNVKEKNLERISQLFGTEIVTSVASMVNIPQVFTNYHAA